jgi:hypothetical protein
MKYIIICFTFFLLIISCKKSDEEEKYTDGSIEYKITYLENELKEISPGLLPKKMKLEFNSHYSTNTIEGFMGFFKLHSQTNFKNKRCATLLEVLNKKYVFNGKRGEYMCCFDNIDNMEVEYTDDTKVIAGLNSKKAIIRLPGNDESFEIYYTDEIYIDEPNSTNPYIQIKGVLMDFQLNLIYLKMQFTAEKFMPAQNKKIQKLNLPEKYQEVTREQMTYIIKRLME